jgi:very long chain acyl-CoA dehydrogenase
MAYMVAGNMDRGFQDFQIEAAISKIFGSEAAWHVVDEAIQIMGGMGFMKETGLERVLRDLRIFRIFEGTNDILRLFVALTGIQHAGAHLRELQQAMKNPASNVGLILGEATKRAFKSVGLASVSKELVPFAHSSLSEPAGLASQAVAEIGASVEAVLIKFGKGIIEEQFYLNRLAEATIDAYAMAVVLSRASKAIEKNLPSAAHESLMAQVWCNEAYDRIQSNLGQMKSARSQKNFKSMAQISQNICKEGGVAHQGPLGI